MAINRNDWINEVKQDAYGVTGNPAQLSTASGSAPSYSARAWVNFNGTATGVFGGGASTVSRIAGSNTATVTTTNDHNLITGHDVFVLTGVVTGSYVVTVLTSKTFTINTVSTTVLTNVAITFAVNTIRASGNVSSVTDNGVGDYTINFTIAMPDVNYSYSLSGQSPQTLGEIYLGVQFNQAPTTTTIRVRSFTNSTVTANDAQAYCVQIFR